MYFDKCDHHSGVYTLRFATKTAVADSTDSNGWLLVLYGIRFNKRSMADLPLRFYGIDRGGNTLSNLVCKRGVAGFVPEANANLPKHSLQG